MKIVYNNIIPFEGFLAMTIYPFIFVKKKYRYMFNDKDIRHETIHSKQQIELLIIIFFIWYLLEYIFRIFQYWNLNKAYRNICFEREAFANENNKEYLDNRKLFSFIKYLWI